MGQYICAKGIRTAAKALLSGFALLGLCACQSAAEQQQTLAKLSSLQQELIQLTAELEAEASLRASKQKAVEETQALLARKLHARAGVAVIDLSEGLIYDAQGEERFLLCSTFKTLAAAAALARGSEFYEQKVELKAEDILSYAPVTKALVGQQLSLLELCAMAMEQSDNTAANLVLRALGGPQALTVWLRKLGDNVTRLDDYEPELNEADPEGLANTTTALAMAELYQRLLLGNVLPETERALLYQMLLSNKGSAGMLRAVAPESIAVADRTGAGALGTRGIAALVGTLAEPKLIVVIYVSDTKAELAARDAAVAAAGRIIFRAFLQQES